MPTNKKGNKAIPSEAIESAVGSGVSVTALDIGIEKNERGIETIVFNSMRRDIPAEVLSSELVEGMTIKAEDNVQEQELGE